MDISLTCAVRVYLTSQDTPMQSPPRDRHVYVVGLLHRRGLGNKVIYSSQNFQSGGLNFSICSAASSGLSLAGLFVGSGFSYEANSAS